MPIKGIIEDWTGPYQFQFLSGGVGVDMTGYYRVGIILWPNEGMSAIKEFSVGTGGNGKAQIDDLVNGKLSMLPVDTDILVADGIYWVQGFVMWSAVQTSYYPSVLPPHADGVELKVYRKAE